MKKFLSILGVFATILLAAVIHVKGYSVSPEHLAEHFKHAFHAGASVVTAASLIVVDENRMRAALQRVQAITAKATGITGNSYIITPGYINSEIVIDNSTTTYNFEVRDLALQSGSAPRKLVRGVKDNDLMFVYDIGLFIDSRQVGKTDVNLLAYPNTTAFTAAGGTIAHLQTFYNAEFSAQVGQTVFVDNYSTRNFNWVPETQQSSSTNLSEWSLKCAVKPFDPYIIISGKADNKILVTTKTFTGFDAAAVTDGYENVLSLFMSAIIVRNGANDLNSFQAALASSPAQQG